MKKPGRPTKRLLRFIAWMQWAAFYAHGSRGFTLAERRKIMNRLETGLTEAEKAQLSELWTDDVEIVRKVQI